MSNTPEKEPRHDKPLPDPVGEDGIVHPDDSKPAGEKEMDEEDAGLTDIGAGRPGERKII